MKLKVDDSLLNEKNKVKECKKKFSSNNIEACNGYRRKKRTFAVNVFVRAFATVRGVQTFHAVATFETLPVPRLNIQRILKVWVRKPHASINVTSLQVQAVITITYDVTTQDQGNNFLLTYGTFRYLDNIYLYLVRHNASLNQESCCNLCI